MGAKVIISEESYFFPGETGVILESDSEHSYMVRLDDPKGWVTCPLIRKEFVKKVDLRNNT